MAVVGEKFKNNEIFGTGDAGSSKSNEKRCRSTETTSFSGKHRAMGKLIIATVAGDLHDIGKNLVAMMIESAGFEVIDLRVDVPIEKIIECYKANPDTKIVCLSALRQQQCRP